MSCAGSSGFVFNTGYASDTSALPVGSLDSHWITGGGSAAGPSSVSNWASADVISIRGGWATSPFNNAQWIAANRGIWVAANTYYRFDFDLANDVDASSFSLTLHFYADDYVVAVYVNGVKQVVPGLPGGNWISPAIANIRTGWQDGRNSVVIQTYDVSGPGSNNGFLAQAQTASLCAKATMTVRTVSQGGAGTFGYSGSNGFVRQNVSTVTPGTVAAGARQTLSGLNVATTITQDAPPAGSYLKSVSCTGMGTGGTATATINGAAGGSVLLNADAVSNNRNIACTFTNVGPPSLTKAFSPGTFASGGTTTLSFTLSNPTDSSATTASFRDTLPTGLVVAATPAVGGTCSNVGTVGVVGASAGAGLIAVSGVSIPAGAACTVTVAVTNLNGATNASCSANPGGFTNAAANISGLTGAANGVGSACVVVPPPSTAQSGARAATDRQLANGTAQNQLEVLVRDASGAGVGAQAVSFSPTAGVDLGGGTGAGFSCVTAATGICTVNATSTVAGAYSTAVAIGASALTGSFSVAGHNYGASPLAYRFVLPAPTVGKVFAPGSVAPSGLSTLTVTLTNPGPTLPIAGAAFTDTYPTGLSNGASPAAQTTCRDAVVSATPGGGSLALTGATIPAGGSCTVTVQVTSTSLGSYTNSLSVGAVTATNAAASASAASAVLAVRAQAVVRLQKITTGGVGATFAFSQTNLSGTPAPITPVSVNSPTPAAPAAITVSAIRTAVTLAEAPAANFVLTDARCSDTNAAVTGNPAGMGTLLGNTLTVAAANVVPGSDLLCVFTSAYRPGIGGRVFSDTGVGGGLPNDGILNGAEPGRSGVAVSLGDCAAAIHATAVTDGGGRYSLAVPTTVAAGSRLCVDTSHGAERHSTGASVAGRALTLGAATPVASDVFTYTRSPAFDRIELIWAGAGAATIDTMNLGSVPVASFVGDGLASGQAGVSVHYNHVFTAGSGGSLSFSVTDSVSSPSTAGWSQRVFADPGCTGGLQTGATQLFPPAVAQTVLAGQVVCVILQESIPAQASPGSHADTTLQAGFALTNASPPLSANYRVNDVTTVSNQALELKKEVRNITQGVSAFGVTNQARPGDKLEYRISYTNISPTPLNALSINDTTPVYTTFESASAASLPAALTSCGKTTPADVGKVDCAVVQPRGGHGALIWEFSGVLDPGAAGSVLFQVVVD